jgi:tetratricopeptide (TPR) repeat protein
MLERIQQKVASGERLSDAELEELERAAQEQGGPTLRTAVAQALINADESQLALPILEAVRRDFPASQHAHLAMGRALVSLEKWSEAEASLERAQQLNPRDPEPLKALAVLDLRRGEWRRARARVDEALQLDPFDGEALVLLAELEATGSGELDSGTTLDDFTHALVEQLKVRSTPHLLQKDQLLVRVGSSVARLSLENLYEDYRSSGRALNEAASLIARELAERSLGLPPGRLHLLARVLPVLRDSAFLERGVGSARREGPGGLWIFYALEDPELVRYVPDGALAPYRVALEELDGAAWKNLEARPTKVCHLELFQGSLRLAPWPTGLWALAEGDGHDAVRLLTSSHQHALREATGAQAWRVYLGLRELVLVCREDDPVSLEKVAALDAARDGIGGAWRLSDGRLSPLSEPDA